MTPSSVHDIRNLALFGHAGSGKTTLVEALLAAAGEIGAPGSGPALTCRIATRARQAQT